MHFFLSTILITLHCYTHIVDTRYKLGLYLMCLFSFLGGQYPLVKLDSIAVVGSAGGKRCIVTPY